MKYLTRDFLTMASASCPGTNMYALAIFLMGCGGYTVVGQTNFDIGEGVCSLANGISASVLNTFAGLGTAYVSIPTGSYSLSPADVNRILVLKPQFNPEWNAGLFRITAVNTINNVATIDYRANSIPVSEDYIAWNLFVDEVTASAQWKSGSNGRSGYGSWSPSTPVSASASRIIMKSPDPSSWQVRMCLESLHDVTGSAPCGLSISPGFGGNSTGDFFELPPGEEGAGRRLFLHGAAYYDTTSSAYHGMTVGLSPLTRTSPSSSLWTKGQWRISMLVDDVSGTCGIINRNVSLPTTVNSGSGWALFGICEDETENPTQTNLSDATVNCPRLFVVGSSNEASNLTWDSQFHSDNMMQVVGFSKRGYPIPGVLSCYSDISNPASHVRYLTSSIDTPWIRGIELSDVEVLVGTIDTAAHPLSGSLFPLQPRRLGRLPMFMQGRANVTTWSTTNDFDYYHTRDGVFMEWGGPPPTDATVSGTYNTMKSTYEDHEGLVSYQAFHPGSDPVVPAVDPRITDIDSTRYRKTYSYFRQVPVPIGFVKGGTTRTKG